MIAHYREAGRRVGVIAVDPSSAYSGGAILGDRASTGCNAVLNPGTVLGKDVLVYACTAIRGYVPHKTIVKLRQPTEQAELR